MLIQHCHLWLLTTDEKLKDYAYESKKLVISNMVYDTCKYFNLQLNEFFEKVKAVPETNYVIFLRKELGILGE